MDSYSTNLTTKKKFFKKAYHKALLHFWGIKKGSLVRNHFGICKIKSITKDCRLVLELIKPDKPSINNFHQTKMGSNVTILNITTKDGESLFEAENYLKFRQAWERKKIQVGKDWKKLQQEKIESLRKDPTISYGNKKQPDIF